MPGRTADRGLNRHILVSSVFLVLALAGWAGLAYSARSSAVRQDEIAEQVRRIESEHRELRAERDRLLSEQRERASLAAENDYLRSRVTALEAEGRTLAQDRDQVRTDLAAARQELAAVQERLSQQQSEAENAAATGATRSARRRGFRSSRSGSR
jgi:outer membrane murein-binding lipoprotein Lpp